MYLLFEHHCVLFLKEKITKKNLTLLSHGSGNTNTEPAVKSNMEDGLIEVHMVVINFWFNQWQANQFSCFGC